ncbi:MAG: hypothetical protein RR640_06525, partial [Oscillospiraceae bacterium]
NLKRIVALSLCLTAFSATALTTLASENEVELNYEYANEPSYSITVPQTLNMTKSGTDFTFAINDVANLGSKTIDVSIAGTDYFRNQMIIVGENTRAAMRYQIITSDGQVIETKGGKDEVNGKVVASFKENGISTCKFVPVVDISTKPDNYSGSITFNVDVADAK